MANQPLPTAPLLTPVRGANLLGALPPEDGSTLPAAPVSLCFLTRLAAMVTPALVLLYLAFSRPLLAAANASEGQALIDGLLGPPGQRAPLEWIVGRADLHGARALLFAWLALAVVWARWRPRFALSAVALSAVALSFLFADTPLVRRLLVGERTSVVDAAAAPTFLFAAGLLAAGFWQRRGQRRAGLVLLAALPFLVFAGEEASWGQHWFGYTTPAGVAALNVQGEFNLHNLDTRISNALFLEAALFAFLLVPALLRRRARRDLGAALFFGGFALYFLACTRWRDGIDPIVVEGTYRNLALANAGLAALAPVALRSRFGEVALEVVRTHFVVSPGLRVAARAAFAGWLVFGLVLGCVGALQLRPLTYLPNVDDELFELLVAMLGVVFASDQLRSAMAARSAALRRAAADLEHAA